MAQSLGDRWDPEDLTQSELCPRQWGCGKEQVRGSQLGGGERRSGWSPWPKAGHVLASGPEGLAGAGLLEVLRGAPWPQHLRLVKLFWWVP